MGYRYIASRLIGRNGADPIKPLLDRMMSVHTRNNLFRTLVLGTTAAWIGLAHAQRSCGTMEYLQQQMAADPDRAVLLQQADDHAAQYAADHAHGVARSLVIVPVVVHVVWNTSSENVSDARIQAQIDQLNLDFAHNNSDAGNTPAAFAGLAANTDVQFCLAQRDPSGNATSGIERRQTSTSSFNTNDNVKRYNNGGLNAWSSDDYLNLWVCDLGSGLLGYAQFPGGPASTDGVVVDYSTVGSMTVPGTGGVFKYGRSATHEIGHWMNLRHIWGDDGNGCNGSDQVADTPNQADETYGCPSFPRVSCSNGPNGDMFMNYMDYSDDLCMNLFTSGQADRMQSVFSNGGDREAITSSLGCTPPSGGSCNTPGGLSTTGITSNSADLDWNAVSGAVSYDVQFRVSGTGTWSSDNITSTSGTLSGLTAGTDYEWQVRANCASGSSPYSSIMSFTTTGGSGSCTDNYEPNNSKGSAVSIAVNTDLQALLGASGDNDWYKFNNSSSQRNIQIDLSNLPADYDIKLYKGSTLVGSSQNGGTTSEQIVYNGGAVGTYKLRVYGYQNAWDADQCYTLRASVSGSTFRLEGEEIAPVAAFDANEPLQLYPNPATREVTLTYHADHEEQLRLSLLDGLGRVVHNHTETMAAGGNALLIDLPELPDGVYFVHLQTETGSRMGRLVIQH